ncbi:hypothetical protein BV898_06054 [Hypsibius exemplaris]|uniref:Uncharacterized protein n=1 Tax=Hypsibius exemplaris TaxID=2072580 RepID=A0A1W0WXY0_HYPEX|nr:hypothetical protein BV898_06054 [Hypsibius exemplaris]
MAANYDDDTFRRNISGCETTLRGTCISGRRKKKGFGPDWGRTLLVKSSKLKRDVTGRGQVKTCPDLACETPQQRHSEGVTIIFAKKIGPTYPAAAPQFDPVLCLSKASTV